MKRTRLSRHLIFLLAGIWIFTNSSCTRTKNESAADHEPAIPAVAASPDNRPVIVAFGDSLTAGAGVAQDRNYPSQLQKKIDTEKYNYRVINAGVSGETSGQGLNRLRSIVKLRPSIVIVELGANDGLRGMPVEATRRNLAAIVQGLQSAGAKVILAGMRVPPNYGLHYAGEFYDVFGEVAEQFDIPLIPFFLEGVGGDASLNQDDGIHPTAAGYEIVVENVWAKLQPLL